MSPNLYDVSPAYYDGKRVGYLASGCGNEDGRLVIDTVADLRRRGAYRPDC